MDGREVLAAGSPNRGTWASRWLARSTTGKWLTENRGRGGERKAGADSIPGHIAPGGTPSFRLGAGGGRRDQRRASGAPDRARAPEHPLPIVAIPRMITPSTKRSLLTCGLVALAATIVMLPRLALPHFGLLDDGALPIASAAVVRQMTGQELGAVFQIESRLGLFRPVYWFSYGGQYLLWGANPLTFFLSLYLGLVATSLLVAGAIVTATKDPRAR